MRDEKAYTNGVRAPVVAPTAMSVSGRLAEHVVGEDAGDQHADRPDAVQEGIQTSQHRAGQCHGADQGSPTRISTSNLRRP